MGSNNRKTVLRYPQYQEAVNSYLGLEEFKILAAETIRGKRITVTALCNYLGDDGTYSAYKKHPVSRKEIFHRSALS